MVNEYTSMYKFPKHLSIFRIKSMIECICDQTSTQKLQKLAKRALVCVYSTLVLVGG